MTQSINELNSDLFEAPEDDRARDPKKARKKAMDLLARREYGFAELVGRVKAAGFDGDVATSVVTVLSDENLQDDERFAESFARAKMVAAPARCAFVRHCSKKAWLKAWSIVR